MRIANSLLNRQAFSDATSSLSSLQAQVDGLVESFARQATDWRSLAALTAGGMAYRAGRVGTMGLRVGVYGHTPLGAAAVAAGLTAEVSAFEVAHRLLHSVGAGPRARPSVEGNHPPKGRRA